MGYECPLPDCPCVFERAGERVDHVVDDHDGVARFMRGEFT